MKVSSTTRDKYHVYPIADLRPHVTEGDCWCKPTENEHGVIVHNSMDGREAYEYGRKKH